MLQAIRDKSKGVLFGVVLFIICVPFAFFGIQNYFFTQVDDSVAKINEAEISLDEFQGQFNRYRANMQARFGGSFDSSYFDQPLVRRQFLDNMIQEEVVSQAASEAGMTVTADQVRREIDAIEVFKVEGRFDPDVYRTVLRQQGMSPRDFESRVRRELLLRELPATISDTSLVLPGEIARVARLQNQRRSFQYFSISTADFAEAIEVSDEDVQAYYDDNPSLYMEPEKVTIEYVELDAAMMSPETPPSDEELRQRYEDQKIRFVLPERRLTSHILISVPENADAETLSAARDRAQELAERARAGEDFEALAQEYSEDEGSAGFGGDLGWVERGFMVSAFEDALFGMQAGDISDPVNTSFGFHVIWLRELEESRGKTFEEAQPELVQEYQEIEAERMFLDRQDRLLDLTYEDQGTLVPAAEELGLEIMTEGPFPATGGEGIAAEPAVTEAAFSDLVLNEGITSDPITVGPNHVVFLRVVNRIEPVRKAIETVSDEIRNTLRNERALQLARQQAESLLARARSGESMETLAAEVEKDLSSADDVQRNAPGHPGAVVSAVFRMPRTDGAAAFDLVEVGADQFSVVALGDVDDPDPSSFSEDQNEALKSRVARSYSTGEVSALTELLVSNAEVSVFEERLNQQQQVN